MIRHLFVTALRNMAANKLLSAISIIGLAIGLAGAILMALVIRNQLSFDHFMPGHERTYMAVTVFPAVNGRPAVYDLRTHRDTAKALKLNLPQVENSARLYLTDADNGGAVLVRQGNVAGGEEIYWADPQIFLVLPLPSLEGNPKAALDQPDGIVLTRAMARKYFGTRDALGKALFFAGHSMTVRAVIEDIPANDSALRSGIFASAKASFSPLAPGQAPNNLGFDIQTFFRLKPGADIAAVASAAPGLLFPLFVHLGGPTPKTLLLPLDQISLSEHFNPGIGQRLALSALTGFLLLLIAALNFVNLLTARNARRGPEVGMRKVCGAGRPALMTQFLGETFLAVLLAALLALAGSEWLLPAVNALLGSGAALDYNPALMGWLALGIVLLSILAGAYPAFVLSSFRPVQNFKGWIAKTPSGDLLRGGFVALQFAILIGMVIAAVIVYRQRSFATAQSLRVPADQIVLLRVPMGQSCPATLKTELRKLPGVEGAYCTGGEFMGSDRPPTLILPGTGAAVDALRIDWGVLSLYGLKPLAGSLAPLSATGDADQSKPQSAMVISQAAVARLGFASPQAAIGRLTGRRKDIPIVAVVPDFSLYTVEKPMSPTVYMGMLKGGGMGYGIVLHAKLSGRQIPETLAVIDRLWSATWPDKPVDRTFLNQYLENQYRALTRETRLFAIFSSLALLLACLGLVGIAVATAGRRVKEIGIRKAAGATNSEIVMLLLWQFAQPVLWANLIAWPLAWWAMNRWLSGFAYHVAMPYWLFPAAGVAMLFIALATVAGQAFLVARQKPVLALRYE